MCKEHGDQKNQFVSDEEYDRMINCVYHKKFFEESNVFDRFEFLHTPCEIDRYNCSKVFHVLKEYNSSYDNEFTFFVFEDEREFGTTEFVVTEH